jgi:hypothetical protein
MANTIGPKAAQSSPMPAEEMDRPPLMRHIDFFDKNKNGELTVGEIAGGLEQMGFGKMKANLIALGTVLVRGPATTGKLNLKIDINNAMKSEQAGATHLFQKDGTVDMAKVEDFIKALNPKNKARITQADFAAYGKKLAQDHVPGNGALDKVKRFGQREQFKIAWDGIFGIVGRKGPDGKSYLTNDDMRWFYDGSLFYRRAADVEAQKPKGDGWQGK